MCRFFCRLSHLTRLSSCLRALDKDALCHPSLFGHRWCVTWEVGQPLCGFHDLPSENGPSDVFFFFEQTEEVMNICKQHLQSTSPDFRFASQHLQHSFRPSLDHSTGASQRESETRSHAVGKGSAPRMSSIVRSWNKV